MAEAAVAKRNTHGVLGGIAGLFFGFFLGLDLVLFGVVPFNSAVPFILTVLGLVGGIVWGRFAPLGGRSEKGPPPPAAVREPAPVPGPAPAAAASEEEPGTPPAT